MADHTPSSFSGARRIGIGLNVLARTALVFAVLVMMVHLSGLYFHRVYLSSHTRQELSPRTVAFIKSITNRVQITLYFDRDAELHSMVNALLTEYRALNPRLTVQTVDYLRDNAAALKIKAQYKLANAQGKDDKDLLIFDCDGRTRVVNARALEQVTVEEVPNPKEREFRRKRVAFNGEMIVDAMLLAVTSTEPSHAMFLSGHGEHGINDNEASTGYEKLQQTFAQSFITNSTLTLLGTNGVPAECDLLIVAGPRSALAEIELEKIQAYLDQGGRMLVMFNPVDRTRDTGLERLLVRYDLLVGEGSVLDPGNSEKGQDVIISGFTKHPIVNPLLGQGVQMILPRPLTPMQSQKTATDAPKVEVLAATSANALIVGEPDTKRAQFAVAAAIEKGAVTGVATARGATRIVVIGDSSLFVNALIEKWANRDLAGYIANWLIERPQLLGGVGPKPVTEFRIQMTQDELRMSRWLLLGALPGSVLAFGWLVWLRRRK
jgi:hypothetical protein